MVCVPPDPAQPPTARSRESPRSQSDDPCRTRHAYASALHRHGHLRCGQHGHPAGRRPSDLVCAAFLSCTDLHEQLAVQTFVLGEAVEDMVGFERERTCADTEQAISEPLKRERAFEPRED